MKEKKENTKKIFISNYNNAEGGGDYNVYYSYIINREDKITREGDVCFSKLFSDVNDITFCQKKGIIETLKLEVKLFKRKQKNHFCFFSKKEIFEYLEEIKKVVDLNYEIEENNEYYYLKICTENKNIVQIKFLVTAIRCLFEAYHSISLLVANYILEKKEIKTNVFNLINIISALWQIQNGHSLFYSSRENNTLDEFKSKLEKSKENLLHNVFCEKDQSKIYDLYDIVFPVRPLKIKNKKDLSEIVFYTKRCYLLFKTNKNIDAKKFSENLKEIFKDNLK